MERTDANPNPPSERLDAQELGAAYPPSSAVAKSWATSDSDPTRAVLARTEEGLREALAALRRNKADIERMARQLNQLLEETGEARRELDRVRAKVKQAEDERPVHQGETVRLREQNPGAPDRAPEQEPGCDEPGPEWESLQEERERLSAELEQVRATYFAYQVESNRSRESLEALKSKLFRTGTAR